MCRGVRIELFTARVLCRVSYRVRVFISGVLHFGYFFENRKNSGLTPGQNGDPDVKDDPNDPLTR